MPTLLLDFPTSSIFNTRVHWAAFGALTCLSGFLFFFPVVRKLLANFVLGHLCVSFIASAWTVFGLFSCCVKSGPYILKVLCVYRVLLLSSQSMCLS